MMASYTPNDKQFAVGDYVVLKNREGYIRFIGKREHYHGTWYGIELTVGQGPNDGSEHGKRYFTCKQRHGIFVRLYAIKKKLDQSEIDPRRLNKSPLSGALPSLPQSTTLSEKGSSNPSSSSRASPRSQSTDTSTAGPTPSPSHFHNNNPHHHHYNLKLSNHLMATGATSRPGSTRASKKSSKLSLWQKPTTRPKSTRASKVNTKPLKLKSITSFNSKSKGSSRDGSSSRVCSPKTPTLTPSLISSPRTIATSPSPSVSPVQSPTGYSRIHPNHINYNHIYLSNTRSNSPRTPRSSIKGSISARVKGGHYKRDTIEIIDSDTSDGEDSDSDEQNLATPKNGIKRISKRSRTNSKAKSPQNGKVRFFGDDTRNVVLPMDRASTISVTDKIASTMRRKQDKKNKRDGNKKENKKRERSRSRDTKRNKNKNKNKKRSKSKRGGSSKSKDNHDRGRTDIDIFKNKKDKRRKQSQHKEMNDQEKLREINRIKKYDKRESFHKRKSRTLDFTLNAHREDLKQIMQFRADSTSSDDDDDIDDDDDDDLEERKHERKHSHSHKSQLILPPIPPQSPGKYTFRLHIKNKNNNDGHNRKMSGGGGNNGHIQNKKSYELQLSNHDKPVPLALKQSYSLSDDHQHIGPHLSLAINDSNDEDDDCNNNNNNDIAIVGYNTGRQRADTNNSESSNIAHTYEVTDDMNYNRYGHLPHDAQMQIENNKMGLLKKDLWGLDLLPDTPMDSDNDQFDSAYDRIHYDRVPYGGHRRQMSNKMRGLFLENNGFNKKSQAFHPLHYNQNEEYNENEENIDEYPSKSSSQLMSELGKSRKIVITPENTMSNGSSNDEMDLIDDDDETLNDDILFISQNNIKKTKLSIPRNDTNGNNLNTKTNPMTFEIDESVIEYHVPSINKKKKKNQNIKINIHINNDIINNKKSNGNNNNGNKNKLCGHSLNPKFTFNPNHISCHNQQEQKEEEEEEIKKHQHRRMKSSSKQKRNNNNKLKGGKHRYSRSSMGMGQELMMELPIHHKKKKKHKKKKSSKKIIPPKISIKKHKHKHKHKHRSNTLEARHEIPPRPSSTRPSKTNKMKNKKPTHRRHASRTTSSHRHSSKSKKNCACHKHHDSQYSHGDRDRHRNRSSSKKKHKSSLSSSTKTKKDKKSNKQQIRFRSKSGKPRNPIPPISPRNIGFKRHQSMQQTYDWTGLV